MLSDNHFLRLASSWDFPPFRGLVFGSRVAVVHLQVDCGTVCGFFPTGNDGRNGIWQKKHCKLFQDVELEVDGFLVSCTICPCFRSSGQFFGNTQVLNS